ncbi:hypothetical protein KEU06_17645 [Pseudaminobacter sp. 19-2017]|uniref:Uncharacterized protein n=1 Tax=Pseudaminobacter soli (ex Zhang et al. 2022) TaxID=2831468 RepID=A0A942E3S8_9HYPH|nr:hypothetical protein [Pseudaminobacter soli]MBS3650441.1 hypothetical protein [Pseudaminobacter soli]
MQEELPNEVIILDYDPSCYAELRNVYNSGRTTSEPATLQPDQLDQILANGAGIFRRRQTTPRTNCSSSPGYWPIGR